LVKIKIDKWEYSIMWGPEIKLYVPKVLFEFTVHNHQPQFEDGVTDRQMLAVAKYGSSWVAAQRWDKLH
jgi:hypothetical protein